MILRHYWWCLSLVSGLTVMFDRWASSCTTPRCRPCCGLESVPGSSTKSLCGECHGSRRESLLLHLLSDQCSGQGVSHNSPAPTSHTMGLLSAVNWVYVSDRCRSSGAWPPRLCSIKVGLCARQPRSFCL